MDSINTDTDSLQPEDRRPEETSGDYKFNLGLARLETINSIINACARKYHKALSKKEAEYVENYQTMVNVLYTEIYVYMEDDTDFEFDIIETDSKDKEEVLRQVLDDNRDYEDEEDMMLHLQQIRSVYLGIRELMKKLKLDIPKEEKIGQTDIFNK